MFNVVRRKFVSGGTSSSIPTTRGTSSCVGAATVVVDTPCTHSHLPHEWLPIPSDSSTSRTICSGELDKCTYSANVAKVAQLPSAHRGHTDIPRLNNSDNKSISSSGVVLSSAWRVKGIGGSTSALLSPSRRSFQPFSAKEEEELVHVLSTKPKHVARHIRQTMLQSSKHISQFRNSVTYLMIMLQGQLQKKEITPENAAIVIQGIMNETVATRQSDMAHLLFRAAIRFRKYGVRLSTDCVRILFESYRGSQARELMLSLANELRNEKDMRAIVISAFMFAGNKDAAVEVRNEIPKEEYNTDIFIALVNGLGVLGDHLAIPNIVREAFDVQSQVDLPAIASAAVIAARGTREAMDSLFKSSLESGIPLSDTAVSHVVRIRVYEASSLAEVYQVEKTLREELGTDSFGLSAETAILSKCSDLVARSHCIADETMFGKVKSLQAVIESSDEIEIPYMMSLLKGYGVLGKVDEMNAIFDNLKVKHQIDGRLYDEVIRWNGDAENVKNVIRYKEEMETNNIRHSPNTYINIFRCLDKFYPRMVEKYYNEMMTKGFAIDAKMYPVLLQVFGDIGDMSMVEQLYEEMRIKSSQGMDVFTAKTSRVLLNIFRDSETRCEEIISQANNRGHLSSFALKHAMLKFYSKHNRESELLALVNGMNTKTPETYRILLRHYGLRNKKRHFEEVMSEMKTNNVSFDDETVRVLITTFSKWGDAFRVRSVLSEASQIDGVHSALFYADAAAAFSRVGDMESMDQVWTDLVESKVNITMTVFNRFLDLYMSVNNIEKVQYILSHMMQHVPPNPVTATTVLDMLGKMGRLNEMEALFDEMTKSKNANPTVVTFHQAMSAYAKVGDILKVEGIRDKMREAGLPESAVTYNILVESYGRAKRYEHIAELIQERRSKGIHMEEFGYIGLINTYARAKMGDEVNDVVASLLGSGVALNARLLSVIATAYSFIGDLEKVEHYVKLLMDHPTRRQRDIESIFVMYSRLRDTKKLEELLEVYPRTEFVYNICIGSFAKVGDYVRVASLLDEMEKKKMVLQRNTSITLSSLLLKAGKVELAQAVLNWKGNSTGAEHETVAVATDNGNLSSSNIIDEQLKEM
eukprot:Tbor_TRINITY_DN5650_c3_g1::TRINITY_DN5650_c3_g1_i1::g.8992::m.8992